MGTFSSSRVSLTSIIAWEAFRAIDSLKAVRFLIAFCAPASMDWSSVIWASYSTIFFFNSAIFPYNTIKFNPLRFLQRKYHFNLRVVVNLLLFEFKQFLILHDFLFLINSQIAQLQVVCVILTIPACFVSSYLISLSSFSIFFIAISSSRI